MSKARQNWVHCPVWYERLTEKFLDEDDVGMFSVGGHLNFGTHIGYLEQFEVPWVIICDGPAIGDAGQRCVVADQLVECGYPVDPNSIANFGFTERVVQLQKFNVLTLATAWVMKLRRPTSSDKATQPHAQPIGGKSKARLAQFVAENNDWDSAGNLVREAVARLAS